MAVKNKIKNQASVNKNNNKQADDSDSSKTWTISEKGDNSLTGTADDTVRRGKSVAVMSQTRASIPFKFCNSDKRCVRIF